MLPVQKFITTIIVRTNNQILFSVYVMRDNFVN